MKTGLFLAALVQLAAAQPHHNRHERLHEKRDVVTVVNTVTATAPDVVIFVDAAGNPISTSYCTESPAQATPATFTQPAPAPANPTPAAPVEHHHHHHHQKGHKGHKDHKIKVAAAGSGPAGHAGHGGHHSSADKSLGIVYSPYNADGTCKSQDQVNSDFGNLSGYQMVRIYGTDCDQVSTVGSAAQAHGMKVFAGVFDLSDIVGDVQLIVSGFKNNWAGIDTVSIGNELVNSGLATPDQVIAALNIARPILRAAGFQGSIVTVDTFTALIANPELCQASDYAAANAHAFFDPTVQAADAGSWAKSTAEQVQQACGKTVVLTESGWPHQGDPNGQAIPGYAEQAAAISSLKSHFSDGGLILFTAYDDLWKVNSAATFNAEQFWGIYSGQ